MLHCISVSSNLWLQKLVQGGSPELSKVNWLYGYRIEKIFLPLWPTQRRQNADNSFSLLDFASPDKRPGSICRFSSFIAFLLKPHKVKYSLLTVLKILHSLVQWDIILSWLFSFFSDHFLTELLNGHILLLSSPCTYVYPVKTR